VLLDAALLGIEIGALRIPAWKSLGFLRPLSAVTIPGITASIHAGQAVSIHEVPSSPRRGGALPRV
jgi:hypothetical protein